MSANGDSVIGTGVPTFDNANVSVASDINKTGKTTSSLGRQVNWDGYARLTADVTNGRTGHPAGTATVVNPRADRPTCVGVQIQREADRAAAGPPGRADVIADPLIAQMITGSRRP